MAIDRDGSIAAFRLSATTIVWTVCVSSIQITLGIRHQILSLVAFGAAGALDAAGSFALVTHFRHALRHDELADRHERRAALIVGTGLALLGLMTSVESVRRLALGHAGKSTTLGVVLAAASIGVLGALSYAKVRVASRVGSDALRADGHLSGAGAALAGVAIVGATLGTRDATAWIDPLAALLIGFAAAVYGLVTTVPIWRAGRLRSADSAERP